MKYRELFGIPFWQGNIKNNEDFKSALMPLIKSTIGDKTKKPESWKTEKLITSFENKDNINQKIFDTEKGIELQKVYWDDCVNSVMDRAWKADMHNMWFNYYEDGEWQEPHNHIDYINRTDFVFVHFLSLDKERHKPLVFHDPLDAIRSTSFQHQNANESGTWSPELNEGDWVIFPPWLYHSVPTQPSTPDYPRVTVSWNMQVTKYGDVETKV